MENLHFQSVTHRWIIRTSPQLRGQIVVITQKMNSAFFGKDSEFGLRKFTEADLDALFEIESDPTLKQFVGGHVRTPRMEWIARARETILLSSVQFALVNLRTGALAGRITLGECAADKQREVQIILAMECVGLGLGRPACELACSYAFGALDAISVCAVVDPKHTASINLVLRLGFTESVPTESKRIFVLHRSA